MDCRFLTINLFSEPLWISPELLRIPDENRPKYGTQAGDVYSYGIILQELILKGSPFANELEQLPVEGIVCLVLCIYSEMAASSDSTELNLFCNQKDRFAIAEMQL